MRCKVTDEVALERPGGAVLSAANEQLQTKTIKSTQKHLNFFYPFARSRSPMVRGRLVGRSHGRQYARFPGHSDGWVVFFSSSMT